MLNWEPIVNKIYENQNLEQENRSSIYRLNELFQLLKKFLRKLLQRGNDSTKDETAEVVKDYYKERVRDFNEDEYDKDDFDLSR